jgi:CelD/BcsL family acetyltransferase involved in cellulose biosynthesis
VSLATHELPGLKPGLAAPPAPRVAPQWMVVINPLEYPNWDGLLAAHQNCSFFHSCAWARVLHETYGHAPHYFCTFADRKLQALLPVMEVSSKLTSRRGVSLPFSDFCLPLGADKDVAALFEAALEYGKGRKWKYLECRNDYLPLNEVDATSSVSFYAHVVELRERSSQSLVGRSSPRAGDGLSEDTLFKQLDSAVRRAIRKAENAGVQVEFGSSPDAVTTFYSLHCQTRKRHGLPPQPFRFFENIAQYVLAAGHGCVATARADGKAIAASLFFNFGSEAIYKFGASDYASQHLRPNNLVMWEAIKRCAANGFARLHLGRTSIANEGLRRFKLGFGAREEKLEYRKYDFAKRAFVTSEDRAESWLNHVFRRFPPSLLRLSGEVLYPHLS